MLKIKREKDEVVVSLFEVKKLNTLFSEIVDRQLKDLVSEPGKKVLFNLEEIRFIDSEGFRVLKESNDLAKDNNTQFLLCNITPEVDELIKLLSLEDTFMTCQRTIGKEKIMVEVRD